METLKEVQKYLNQIDNINTGGCGISALAMYRWLKKNDQLQNTKFVYCYSSKDVYLNNSNVLRNKSGKASATSHAVLLHDGQFIDSKGIKDISIYGWVQIIEEEEFIIKTLNDDVSEWNSYFDRNNIVKIEQELGIDLSDVKRRKE